MVAGPIGETGQFGTKGAPNWPAHAEFGLADYLGLVVTSMNPCCEQGSRLDVSWFPWTILFAVRPSSVVEGRAVYEVVATQGGLVVEMHSNQIEVHLDLGSEQIMGIIVYLLLGQPVG